MIVKANVIDKATGKRKDEYFLVRFDHTPVDKEKQKKGILQRRTGVCSIYYLADSPSWTDAVGKKIDGEFFASRICKEKHKFFVVDQKIVCHEKDNYCKAYSRLVTMQMALNWIIKNQDTEDFLKTLPFKFDNETFKSFVTTLNEQHPHGKTQAMSLIKNHDYRVTQRAAATEDDGKGDDEKIHLTVDVATIKTFLTIVQKLAGNKSEE